MANLINQTIRNQFRVDAFLGRGGMAEVYKVWDRRRSVHLAMKILHADLAEDKVFLRRFHREAQTLEKLQHPNIVRFYGAGRDDDLVYILMEYVEGTTLRKEIFKSEKPFALEDVARIIRPVCAALHYAHQSGFVHSDIKPANILIHQSGTILVTDFGIARMTEAATMTMVGAGTPAYMSPEQARGENPAVETDIYSLGIILFELLTGGERPFTGEQARTTGSTSEKIRWEQLNLQAPSPTIFNPSIPPDLSAIVLKCLDKNPNNRYGSALDVQNALEIVMNKEKITSGKLAKKYPPPKAATKPRVQKKFLIRPTLISNFLRQWRHSKFVKSNLAVLKPNASHSSEHSAARLDRPSKFGLWALMGVTIVSSFIYLLSVFGGQNKQDYRVVEAGGSSAFSAAGTLYFTSDRDGKAEIYKLVNDKADRVTQTDGLAKSWGPTVSGTGTLYFSSNRDKQAEIYKLVGNRAVRVTQTEGKLASSWGPTFSSTGTMYFTSNRDGKAEIYKLVSDKAVRVTQTDDLASSWGPAFSKAGTLYFTSNRDGKAEIYKLVEDKAIRVTQTDGLAGSWEPAFSKEGTLYFTSNRDGKAEIYKLVDDKAIRVTQTDGLAGSWGPIFSNLGILHFTSNRDGKVEIYKLVGDRAVQVTQTKGNAKSWGTIQSLNGWNPTFSTNYRSTLVYSSRKLVIILTKWKYLTSYEMSTTG